MFPQKFVRHNLRLIGLHYISSNCAKEIKTKLYSFFHPQKGDSTPAPPRSSYTTTQSHRYTTITNMQSDLSEQEPIFAIAFSIHFSNWTENLMRKIEMNVNAVK